jgi:hypothetical protein
MPLNGCLPFPFSHPCYPSFPRVTFQIHYLHLSQSGLLRQLKLRPLHSKHHCSQALFKEPEDHRSPGRVSSTDEGIKVQVYIDVSGGLGHQFGELYAQAHSAKPWAAPDGRIFPGIPITHPMLDNTAHFSPTQEALGSTEC